MDQSEPYTEVPAKVAGKVFISYASQDLAVAQKSWIALEGANLPCWIAPRNVRDGESYAAAIVQVIDSCRMLVLVHSKNASGSGHRKLRRRRHHSCGDMDIVTRFGWMSLDAVPADLKLAELSAHIGAQLEVTAVHDLHIWPMSTTETELTCHCVMPAGNPGDDASVRLASNLNKRFGIAHATIQVEIDEHVDCALAPDHTV